MQAGGLAVRIAGGHLFCNGGHCVMMVVPSIVAGNLRAIRGWGLRFGGHMVAMPRRESGRGQKRDQRGHREKRSYGIHTVDIVTPAEGCVKACAAAAVSQFQVESATPKIVIPAKAGIQKVLRKNSGCRNLEGHFRGGLNAAGSAMLRRRTFIPPLPSQARHDKATVVDR